MSNASWCRRAYAAHRCVPVLCPSRSSVGAHDPWNQQVGEGHSTVVISRYPSASAARRRAAELLGVRGFSGMNRARCTPVATPVRRCPSR